MFTISTTKFIYLQNDQSKRRHQEEEDPEEPHLHHQRYRYVTKSYHVCSLISYIVHGSQLLIDTLKKNKSRMPGLSHGSAYLAQKVIGSNLSTRLVPIIVTLMLVPKTTVHSKWYFTSIWQNFNISKLINVIKIKKKIYAGINKQSLAV